MKERADSVGPGRLAFGLLIVAASLWSCERSRETSHPPAGANQQFDASLSAALPGGGTSQPPRMNPTGSPAEVPPAPSPVVVPAGTVLRLALLTPLASDRSRVEDPVRARLVRPVLSGGTSVVPAGSEVLGTVTAVERAGRAKGRARVSVRFHSLVPADTRTSLPIETDRVTWIARDTRKKDAATIALPAAGGAILGGVIGGGKGSAVGAAVGGGTGTAIVLTTRGGEVRLGAGTAVRAALRAPLTLPPPPPGC